MILKNKKLIAIIRQEERLIAMILGNWRWDSSFSFCETKMLILFMKSLILFIGIFVPFFCE